ncbi:hypothetical protein [Chryseobacterium sp. RR2-3-20]
MAFFVSVVDGKPKGEYTHYFDNGQVAVKGNFVNG